MATGYRGYTLTDAPVVQALQRDPRYALSQAQLAQALQSTPQTVPEALVRGLTGIVQARRSRGIEEQYGQQQEALQASRQRLAQALMGGDLAGAAAAASGSPYLADTGIQLGLTNIETQAKAAAEERKARLEAELRPPPAPTIYNVREGNEQVTYERTYNPATRAYDTREVARGAAFSPNQGPSINLSAPVVGIGPDGRPMFYQPDPRGGLRPTDVEAPVPRGGAGGGAPKPMPASVLKLKFDQREGLRAAESAISRIENINRLLEDADPDVEGNQPLVLGPVANRWYQAREFMGKADASTKAFSSINTDIQALRNEILMLHNGVQTEGDAVRALQTITTSLNDREVLKTNLAKLAELNRRAIAIREQNIRELDQQYGFGEPEGFESEEEELARLRALEAASGPNR